MYWNGKSLSILWRMSCIVTISTILSSIIGLPHIGQLEGTLHNFPPISNADVKFIKRLMINIQDLEQLDIAEKDSTLRQLSTIVQSQMDRLQKVHSGNCSTQPALLCGRGTTCGFTCQVNYLAACVAMSYAMNIPMILDDKIWPYDKKFGQAFQQLGINCPQGPTTIVATFPTWVKGKKTIPILRNHSGSRIPHPLKDGLVVPSSIGQLVQKLHLSPVLWWLNQFTTYIMRLNTDQVSRISESMSKLGYAENQHPTIGLHIRRTDKTAEYLESLHSVADYFQSHRFPENIFNPIMLHRNETIFIASDDSTVIDQARRLYPTVRVVGFREKVLRNELSRKPFLDEIIRDVVILSKADFIVCGLISNVCRLVLVLRSHKSDSILRIKSLDWNFEDSSEQFCGRVSLRN